MESPSLIPGRRRAEPLEILAEASELVSGHSLALDELLGALAELTRKVVDYQLFAVLLRHGDRFRIRFSIGYRDEFVRNFRLAMGEGIAGAAAQQRQTIVVSDVNLDPRYLRVVDAVRSEITVPLIARGKLVGLIDLQSTDRDAFGEHERHLLELVVSRFSLAIDAARLHRATVRQNRTLRALSEIAQEFAHILRVEELLKKVCTLIRPLIPFDAFSVLLLEGDRRILKHYFGVRFDERTQWESMPLGRGIVGTAALEGEPILVGDVRRDPRYVAALEGIRSEVAIPLRIKDTVIGVLDLESEQINAFSWDHVRTLSLLAPQIATAIENARLYEQVARNEERLERDLEAARQLQRQLLPAGPPACAGLDVAARNDPASEVTGDLYDFFPFDDGSLGLLLGDVSGKGAAAALYAAMASGLLRNLVLPDHRPADLLEAANDALVERRIGARFLTAVFAKWWPDQRRMLLANAGEPRPILCRRGTIEVLPLAGIPLGLLEASQYEEKELQLEPGDVLVLVSDGITETGEPDGIPYGNRLPGLIESLCDLPARDIVERIFEDVQTFAKGRPQQDDRTVVVARVTG